MNNDLIFLVCLEFGSSLCLVVYDRDKLEWLWLWSAESVVAARESARVESCM